jgi:Alpha-glutamyl/putrescinyl thymine pyrophosphorylase clade 3
MRPRDQSRARELEKNLDAFDRKVQALPGIVDATARTVFIGQLIDSIHRVDFVALLRSRKLSSARTDPSNELFDPLKAAIVHQRAGRIDEAFWMVFLFVYFGKHKGGGWRYAREIYGRLGESGRWDWATISGNPKSFRAWLREHETRLRRPGAGFGNHRKYESLRTEAARGAAAAFESYVTWVGPPRSHAQLVADALLNAGGNRQKAFDGLYRSMDLVKSFGRTARFDYLTMVGKLGLADIEPPHTYMGSSTGPAAGARLLFGGSKTASLRVSQLEDWLLQLDGYLRVGMQVLEDALCNWQKTPRHYARFRG